MVLVGLFGPMGSGKSYEAVAYHILPALKDGQVVATNIKGICDPAQVSYIASHLGKLEVEVQSLLIELPSTKEALFKPGVFPDTLDWSKPSVIPPGCLLVLDETATIFDKQPPDHVLRYLTEQRHGVSPSGHTGRTVVISQSTGIHRSVRTIMSVAYVFSKFSMLEPVMGLLRKFNLGADYRAEVYTDMSKSLGRSKPDNRISRRYDLAVFPCYKSVDADEFRRMGLDSRTTIFGNRFVVLFIPLAIIVIILSFNYIFSKFAPSPDVKPKPVATSPSSSTAKPSAQPPALASQSSVSTYRPLDVNNSGYRLVGDYDYDGTILYIAEDMATSEHVYFTNHDVTSVKRVGPNLFITHRHLGVLTNQRKLIKNESSTSSGAPDQSSGAVRS